MKKFKYIILLLIVLGIGLYLYNVSDINTVSSIRGDTISPKSSGSFGQLKAESK